jgi:hypothetical protein
MYERADVNNAVISQTRALPVTRIAVAHLVRRSNDEKHLRQFIESYTKHPAGIEHQLILLLKGYSASDVIGIKKLTGSIDWHPFIMPDEGRDIGAYLAVARALAFDQFCFLNSYSRVLADDWLLKLHTALETMPRAGVVGATGTWWRPTRDIEFPNYNIRTNGFLIRRETLLSLKLWPIRGRPDAVRFEAGPDGMTRQLMLQGWLPYVVDREGVAWSSEKWPYCQVFWSGDQERLLIADNRTDWYATGRPRLRAWCRKIAWTPERAGRRPGRAPKWMRKLAAKVVGSLLSQEPA